MSRHGNYTQPDPRYFQVGNAFLGGVQQSQDNQRQNALLDIERGQFGLQQRRQGVMEDQYLREIQGQQQAAQQSEMEQQIGLLALKASRGDAQAGAQVLEALGLDPNDADGPELFGVLAEKYGGFKQAGGGGTDAWSIQEYNKALETGFKGSFLDFQKAKQAAGHSYTTMRPTGKKAPPKNVPAVSPEEATNRKITDAENVISAIDTADSLVGFMTTGLVGQILGNLGGTDAYNLRAAAETIKANIGFDRLQRMREESKTGGALGQVAVQELVALQSTIASLDPNQESDQLRRNLRTVRAQYEKAIKAYENAKQEMGGGKDAGWKIEAAD